MFLFYNKFYCWGRNPNLQPNEVINNGSIKNTAEAVLEFVKMVDPDQYSFLEKTFI